MDILFLLVPLSVLLALGVMAVLGWAVWSGQFEALDSEGERILTDPVSEEVPAPPDESCDSNPSGLIHINTTADAGRHT